MTTTKGWGAFGVALAVVLAPFSDIVTATERVSVVVHIDNRADVPPQDLARAKVEANQVFQAAGVEIAWVEGRRPSGVGGSLAATGSARRLSVTLANNLEGSTRGATGCALGLAAPALAGAYIFYNRIIDLSTRRPIDVTVVLGSVIAHELGHLLLPVGSHSRFGIMRADLDLEVKNPRRFTEDQASRIRLALVNDAR